MIILYPQQNNKLAILTSTGVLPIEEVAKKDVPLNVPYKIITALNIDNDFFDAYEFDQEVGAKINISKAKDIWLDHYRRTRTPLLERLDIDFMKAVESGDTALQKEIAAKKQALRDVTKIELPDTLEGIKNTWPEILGEKPF